MLSPKTVSTAVAELGRYTRAILPYDVEAATRSRAVVVLNDWGPVKELIEAANQAGVVTFAKVEGVQDFDDLESHWAR